jgi:N-acetylmuramoyl-L-alanine amidase
MGNIVIKAPKLHIKAKQISNVYFAKEVKDNNKNISFEKIKEGGVDSKMYIVIETENLEKGDVIKVRILQYVAIDEIVNISEQDSQELTITVGNYVDKGGTATQAITPISLGVNKKDNKEFPHFILHKEKTLYVAISVTALKDGKVNKEICYNLKSYKHNYVDNPNVWYGDRNNAFYLERRKPIIVLDPGHGFTGGSDKEVNAGAQARKYTYKIKDGKGKTAFAEDIKDLPQYVLDDPKEWIVGNNSIDSTNRKGIPDKAEYLLVYDVCEKMQTILKGKGFECFLTRKRELKELSSNESALYLRADFANAKKADYFISIHADGDNDFPTGAHSCYTNNSDDALGKELAIDILKFYTVLPINYPHPRKRSNLGLLNNVNKTKEKRLIERRTLVELGFVTTPKDAKIMFENIDKIAEQLVQGLLYNIEKYF